MTQPLSALFRQLNQTENYIGTILQKQIQTPPAKHDPAWPQNLDSAWTEYRRLKEQLLTGHYSPAPVFRKPAQPESSEPQPVL